MRRLLSTVVLSVQLVFACAREPAPTTAPVARAFYYWRTQLALSQLEQRALTELHIDKLYLRLFDVQETPDGTPVVSSALTVTEDSGLPPGLEVVPVVYLSNTMFMQLPSSGVPALAEQVWREVSRLSSQLHIEPREVQLDCDWSDGTQTRFFAFLTALRGLATPSGGVKLSATIRLHQVKFRERTGVPPVERGMLMFYNMGRFSADPDARAIFDARSAEQYLARLDEYPLPLDAALPIWSWTLILRDGQVEGLLQSTDPSELRQHDFLRALGYERFEVTRTTFLHGQLLRAGDVLKGEVTGPSETRAAAELLAPHLAANSARTLSLFDLSERNLNRHAKETLEHTFEALR